MSELGHQVRVLGPYGWQWGFSENSNYSIHRYPRIIRARFTDQGFWSRMLEREFILKFLLDTSIWKCDVVHAHTTYPTGYLTSCAKRIGKRCPLIITPHGDDIHTIPEIGRGMRLNPKLRPKIDLALQNADAITVISDGIEASVLKTGAHEEKIHKIPNGVDLARFQHPSTLDVRKLLNLPDDARIILSVGNYRPCKGLEVLIDAMPKILSIEPRARLVIVGKDTEILKPAIKNLDLVDQVILTGPVQFPALSDKHQDDMLAAIYQQSEIYVSSGVEEGAEGLSLALLEAMANGLPLVGTDISGNREIIKDKVNGLLCTPSNKEDLANKVSQILADTELRLNMRNESVKIANKYRWQEIAQMYIELYKQIIKTKYSD